MFKECLLHTQVFAEQEDVFLFPHSLNFHVYVKNIKISFLVVPGELCKFRELAEDLSQPSSVGHTKS